MKLSFVNCFLVFALIVSIISCSTEQEKNTVKLIEKIKEVRQSALKTENLDIKFLDESEKLAKSFEDSLKKNDKDGKLSKSPVYKTAKDEIYLFKKTVDTLKSKYVLGLLSGTYEGKGIIYYHNEQYNMTLPAGVIQDVLKLRKNGFSEFIIATTRTNGQMVNEDLQISLGDIRTLKDSLITGEILLKPDNSKESKYLCDFEWSHGKLRFSTSLWYVDNKPSN